MLHYIFTEKDMLNYVFTDKNMSFVNRLMTDEEQEKLFSLRSFLATDINITTVEQLVTTGCISLEHMSAINKYTTQVEIKEELLNILRRRSLAQYKLFIQFLHEANQHHVIHRLETYKRKQLFFLLTK